MLKTSAKEKIMKKFIDGAYMVGFLNRCRGKLLPEAKTIEIVRPEKVKFFLSAESYLVRYYVTIIAKNNHKQEIFLRGNRISHAAAEMWFYMHKKSVQDKQNAVPEPLHYFKRKRFMLYREFPGQTLRDYNKNYKILFGTASAIAKRLAWWHSLPISPLIKKWTPRQEQKYWKSNINTIVKYTPDKPALLKKILDELRKTALSEFKNSTKTLCHNDFQASNILFDKTNNHIAIIDFGASTVFSPVADIATYMTHLAVMTHNLLAKKEIHAIQNCFLKTYLSHVSKKLDKEIERYLPLFQARSAVDILAVTVAALEYTKNPKRIKLSQTISGLLTPFIHDRHDKAVKKKTKKIESINSLIIHL